MLVKKYIGDGYTGTLLDRPTWSRCALGSPCLRQSRSEHIWTGLPQIATVNADIT